MPEAKLDFDAPAVSLDWRVFAPDPAAAPFLRVVPAGGDGQAQERRWADWLPLVCRATDHLLLLVLAPPAVEAVSVWKNGKRPLLRDLRTGTLDTDAPAGADRQRRLGARRPVHRGPMRSVSPVTAAGANASAPRAVTRAVVASALRAFRLLSSASAAPGGVVKSASTLTG